MKDNFLNNYDKVSYKDICQDYNNYDKVSYKDICQDYNKIKSESAIVSLKEDDVIILSLKGEYPIDMIDKYYKILKKMFPKYSILVVPNGITLEVYRKNE